MDTPSGTPANDVQDRRIRIMLGIVFVVAVAARLHGLFQDLPFSYYGDELHFVKRSIALGTGDLNPHWFHKPAFLMYMLLATYGAYFAGGFVLGVFPSVEAFGAAFLVNQGPFLLIGRLLVMAFGLGTVVLGQRIGRRIGGPVGGVTTALVLAVLPALVVGSQMVKADVPSAFFVTASVWVYLRGSRDAWRPLLWAAALAGASMGTKYYGVIVLPGLALAEFLPCVQRERAWGAALGRVAVMGVVFAGTFFVTSPYNLLDPTWSKSVQNRLGDFVQVEMPGAVHASEAEVSSGAGADSPGADGAGEDGEDTRRFDPDAGVEFEPGMGAVPGAALHFGRQLLNERAMGPGFLVLSLLGAVALLRSREQRRALCVLGTPVAIFTLLAVTLMAYHVNPRQLNAVFPLLAVLVWPGIQWLLDRIRVRGRGRVILSTCLILIVIFPMVSRTWRVNSLAVRDDSRNRAYEWMLETLPEADRILLDDYGPIVPPSAPAIAILERRLGEFPKGEAFTEHQARQLELLRQFPARTGRNVELLGHPWWLNEETPDAVLRADPHHRDMGNPLVDRTPRSVEEYEAAGYRWIVTNSDAQKRYYRSADSAARFPAFRRFYDALRQREPVQVFDPATWGGKGPTVWIYELPES